MADRGDTHYRTSALNKWFLFSSAFLLVSLVWLMLSDWTRSWKEHQREFREIRLEQARAQAEELEQQVADERQANRARLDAAEEELAARQADLDEVSEELRLAEGELWRLAEEAKKAKADYNWVRYVVEEERIHEGDPTLGREEIEAAEDLMNETALAEEVAQAEVDEIQERVDTLTAERDEAADALASSVRDLERIEEQIAKLAPTGAAKVADVIRDAPGLDFIDPNLKVKKVVLEDLTFDLNFTKKKRLDMCHTCHLGVDQPGFEDEEQPYTSHPRLDLYLSARSPHPMKKVGCTICHRGNGEALEFVRNDHRPDLTGWNGIAHVTDQEEAWEDEYHWHKQKYWDYPMLPLSMTEAGCVQCHKTSMELIADDAPTVTDGYRNFERYGCYACHKVDWFPTKRRPGPNLKNIQAKTSNEWMAAWIANPKAFRPSTWMPRFFHLENFAPDEVIAESHYGEESEEFGPSVEILGQSWNDTAVAAVTAFLADRAPKDEYPEIPVEGDPLRGSEVFRVSGCLACHNMAPWEDDPNLPRDLALEPRDSNEHGPNLRGVATKVDPKWLFAWIKDPAAIWSETRMPNLRLSDQDAADIVAYIMEDPDGYFSDVPEGWQVGVPESDPTTLREMARWFFARDGRTVIEDRLSSGGEWADLQELQLDVGEKLVGHYGCFSCHEISGMETMQPIGVDLSTWASKTVDKLDYGYMHEVLADKHGWDYYKKKHFKEYREAWLMQKLRAPRSYDRRKVKNPIEKLRMPWFEFDDDQVHSITTFVAGLVEDEVQRAKMVPTPAQAESNTGMQAVRQHNCKACHMVDPGSVTYLDDDGVERTVAAELLPVGGAVLPPAHDRESLAAELEYEGEDEFGLRLLRTEPGLGDVGDKLFIDDIDRLVALTSPDGGDLIRLITDYYFYGRQVHDPDSGDPEFPFRSLTGDPDGEYRVQDVDGEWRDFSGEEYDKVRWTYAPPVLWNEGGKVRKEWFYSFLNDVHPLRPQIRVRMPSFNLADDEAAGIADYFAHKSVQEWPAAFTRALRAERDLSAEDLATAAGAEVADIHGIESGERAPTATEFAKVRAHAGEIGFEWWPPVDPDYESVQRRAEGYLAERAAELPNHIEIGEQLAVEKVNCYQCHFRLGTPPPADPIAWAPDFVHVTERLRGDWTKRWLIDPSQIYPGTSMPQNFADNASDYHDVYPGSTSEEQIETVLDYLYNFDRANLAPQ